MKMKLHIVLYYPVRKEDWTDLITLMKMIKPMTASNPMRISPIEILKQA